MLGLFDVFKPKFVRRYAELGTAIGEAAAAYAADVRARRFPGPEHCFGIPQPAAPRAAPGAAPQDAAANAPRGVANRR
jgi:3-methyl-2-oxobutanoate hydroxymethyltransferase